MNGGEDNISPAHIAQNDRERASWNVTWRCAICGGVNFHIRIYMDTRGLRDKNRKISDTWKPSEERKFQYPRVRIHNRRIVVCHSNHLRSRAVWVKVFTLFNDGKKGLKGGRIGLLFGKEEPLWEKILLFFPNPFFCETSAETREWICLLSCQCAKLLCESFFHLFCDRTHVCVCARADMNYLYCASHFRVQSSRNRGESLSEKRKRRVSRDKYYVIFFYKHSVINWRRRSVVSNADSPRGEGKKKIPSLIR